jgi:NADH-quinone oxidoreductase subunit N
MVIGVVISIYYYFGWIREVTFHPKPTFSDDEEQNSPELWEQCGHGIFKPCMIALAVSTLVLGIWQGPFGDAF